MSFLQTGICRTDQTLASEFLPRQSCNPSVAKGLVGNANESNRPTQVCINLEKNFLPFGSQSRLLSLELSLMVARASSTPSGSRKSVPFCESSMFGLAFYFLKNVYRVLDLH